MDSAIEVSGTWNARDVGGYTTTDEGTVMNPGVLYRSATLARLDDTGVARLAQLGITSVLDLRTPDEVARDGTDRLPPDVEVFSLPFGVPEGKESRLVAADVAQAIQESYGELSFDGKALMQQLYRDFVTNAAAHRAVATGLEVLAGSKTGTLVHCSAGKDRTGFFVAIVQLMCGVNQQGVMTEYLRSATSEEKLKKSVPAIIGKNPAIVEPMLRVDSSYMEAAFDQMRAVYASFDGYLDATKIPQSVRKEIRRRFTALATPGKGR